MQQETYQGIPRNQINWHPTINYQKCTSCGKCAAYCKRGVFEHNQTENKTTVKNPNNCKVLCKNCQPQCPQNAISHQSEDETKKYIQTLQNTGL